MKTTNDYKYVSKIHGDDLVTTARAEMKEASYSFVKNYHCANSDFYKFEEFLSDTDNRYYWWAYVVDAMLDVDDEDKPDEEQWPLEILTKLGFNALEYKCLYEDFFMECCDIIQNIQGIEKRYGTRVKKLLENYNLCQELHASLQSWELHDKLTNGVVVWE